MKILFSFFSLIFSFSVLLAQDTLTICSFNIQFLGHFQSKENVLLSEILKDYDIVVVQELVAPPIDGAYKDGVTYKKDLESAAFAEAMSTKGFSYWLSDEDSGPSGNRTASTASEWWIVFYKNDKVRPDSTRAYGFVSSPLAGNPHLDRVPFVFPFKSVKGNSTFTFIPVHLRPGDKTADRERRQTELNTLFNWVSSQTETNKDFYVLGDFNIFKNTEFTAFEAQDFKSLNADCQFTNTKIYEALSKGKPYDHVFYRTASVEDLVPNSFKVIDLMAELIKLAPDQVSTSYNHDQFRQRFSDHLPIEFKIVTGKDSDVRIRQMRPADQLKN
jgi:endonuclease/exonuclease/phosphatase family metal-dependent hydrolase